MIKLFRHRKRGSTYELLSEADAQLAKPTFNELGRPRSRPLHEGDKLAVYRGVVDGRLWVRFADEFHDGRFEDLFPERCWVPTDFCDETAPSPACTPDRWICGKLGKKWLIGPEDNDERKDYGCETVEVGDRVAFSWHEPRGSVDLVFDAEGSWSLQGADPEDWNWVWVDDAWEICGDTIEQVAREVKESGDHVEGEPITLRFCKQGTAAFVLEVNHQGEPIFMLVEGEGAANG